MVDTAELDAAEEEQNTDEPRNGRRNGRGCLVAESPELGMNLVDMVKDLKQPFAAALAAVTQHSSAISIEGSSHPVWSGKLVKCCNLPPMMFPLCCSLPLMLGDARERVGATARLQVHTSYAPTE